MDRFGFESAYDTARKVAHRKALSALGRCGIVLDELEDVESELLLDFYRRLARFDPRRASLGTFAWRVMDRKLVAIVRHRLAQRRLASILVEPLPEDDLHLPSPAPQWELRLEVERVVATLPPPLAELARALCWMSPTEASRFLGCARATIYARIARLRAALVEAGIGPDLLASWRKSRPGERHRKDNPRNCAGFSRSALGEATNRPRPSEPPCGSGRLVELTASAEIPQMQSRGSNGATRTVAEPAGLPAESSQSFITCGVPPQAAPSLFRQEVTC